MSPGAGVEEAADTGAARSGPPGLLRGIANRTGREAGGECRTANADRPDTDSPRTPDDQWGGIGS
jgi:hypothetical protein